MWWLQSAGEEPTIEINLHELKKFIEKEALYIHKMENLLQQSMDFSNLLSGKAFFFFTDFLNTVFLHFWDNVNYFAPKEIKQ
jgi:hypothetical protein